MNNYVTKMVRQSKLFWKFYNKISVDMSRVNIVPKFVLYNMSTIVLIIIICLRFLTCHSSVVNITLNWFDINFKIFQDCFTRLYRRAEVFSILGLWFCRKCWRVAPPCWPSWWAVLAQSLQTCWSVYKKLQLERSSTPLTLFWQDKNSNN